MQFPTIKEERKRRHWTQQQLADKAFVSLSTIRRLETDPDYKPSAVVLKSVSIALSLDYRDLVKPLIANVSVDTDPDHIKQFDEESMLACYNALNDEGKALIKKLAYALSQLDEYKNNEVKK